MNINKTRTLSVFTADIQIGSVPSKTFQTNNIIQNSDYFFYLIL